MHHKKKRKLFVLYSIPIINNLCRKHLVSYSIPLSCMVVLLLGGIVFVNPSLFVNDKSYAVEVGEDVAESIEKTSEESLEPDEEDLASGERDAELATDGTDSSSNSDYNSDIAPQADTITFAIGGQGQSEVVDVDLDKVNYRTHTVTVSVSNAEDYYLMISGDPNLTSTGEAYLTGVTSSTVGSNIPAGKWGYGWDYTGSKSKEAMSYVAIPKTDTKITSIPKLSNGTASFTGNLNFAARFPSITTVGNYASSVSLTLVVTPKAQTTSTSWKDATGKDTNYDAGTDSMQNIDKVQHEDGSGFCKNNSNVKEGWAVDLVDNRDKKTYTVVKLGDGNCWMGQNLALTGPRTLTTNDTDLKTGSTDWLLPASVTAWNASDSNLSQIRTGSTNLTNWKQGYGNYYSWCAATAETCLGSNGYVISNTDADSSICPKGWKLPPNSGIESYTNLIGIYKRWANDAKYNSNTNISGYYFGIDSVLIYKGANFWPAAGYISQTSGVLDGSGSYGAYWSRTAHSVGGYAYRLHFSSSVVYPADDNGAYRSYYGFSVRCVASY